ncbi:MAG: GerMN domain-containing protein [Clostridia bacterium]|nr:GerMN domain-containing protein [Clostridia bacterium]
MTKKFISVITLVSVLACIFLMLGCDSEEQTQSVKLYFLKEDTLTLTSEDREVTKGDNLTDNASIIIAELFKGPKEEGSVSPFPNNVSLNSIKIKKNVAHLDFNGKYKFEKDTDLLLANLCLMSTLCELDDIESIDISVNGNPLTASNGSKIGLLGMKNIIYDSDSLAPGSVTVQLFFASEDGQYLEPEKRTVKLNDEVGSLEYVLVTELLKGPKTDTLQSTIPEETKVLSVETKEGICFVNLSKEFKSEHIGGTAAETMTIYSIVNTLTEELDTIEKVQFLIEGQKVDEFIHYSFKEPFDPDLSLIRD